MRLKYEFEAVSMEDKFILVPVGDDAMKVNGVIKLNGPGLEIVDMLKTDTSEAAIADALAAKYDNGRSDLLCFVQSVLAVLRENGLISE